MCIWPSAKPTWRHGFNGSKRWDDVLARPDPETQKSEFYALPSNLPRKERKGKNGTPLEGISRDLHALVTSFGRRPLEGILCTTGRNEHPCKEIRQACPIRTYASKLRKILCQISSARDKLFLTSSFGNFRNVLLRNTP